METSGLKSHSFWKAGIIFIYSELITLLRTTSTLRSDEALDELARHLEKKIAHQK
jgi:hypothetical protein